MTAIDEDRFDRSIRALGTHSQQQLANTHIAIIGVSGLGNPIAKELARVGVEHLTLIDPDVVEESNLPRLYGNYRSDIDRPKVAVLAEQLRPIASVDTVTTVQEPVEDAADALEPVDLIVAGVDQDATRIWLNKHAVMTDTDYIDAGVSITTQDGDGGRVETMEGYVHRIVPGTTACFDCLDRGDRVHARLETMPPEQQQRAVERGYVDDTALTPEPAVNPLNGIVASLAVETAVKHITGYDDPADFIRYESVSYTLNAKDTVHPRDSCPTCGRTDHTALDLDTDWT